MEGWGGGVRMLDTDWILMPRPRMPLKRCKKPILKNSVFNLDKIKKIRR